MQTWFETKAVYVKIDDDGREVKVSESFLLDAVSFTDAEARMTEQLRSIIRGEFIIDKISKSRIVEIFAHEDGEYWWKGKISIVTIDEKAGKEKVINNFFLVAADDLKQALKRLEKGLSYVLVPYQITSLVLSPIVDVFPYFEENTAIPKNLISLEEAKDKIIGEVGTERRDNLENEIAEALDELEEDCRNNPN